MLLLLVKRYTNTMSQWVYMTLSYMRVYVFNPTPQTHCSDLSASARTSAVCLFVNVCMFVVASVCRLSPVLQQNMDFLSVRVLHLPFWSDYSTTAILLAVWLSWCSGVPPLLRLSRFCWSFLTPKAKTCLDHQACHGKVSNSLSLCVWQQAHVLSFLPKMLITQWRSIACAQDNICGQWREARG